MALVTLPVGATFTRRAWTTPARNQINRSAWTGARTVLRLPGAGYWKVSASVIPMAREIDVRPWRAFMAVLEGSANTFLMPFACGQTAVTGTNPRVAAAGASMGDTSFPVRDLGSAGVKLRGGQAVTVTYTDASTQMFILTQDLVADGSGNGTAHVRGALRQDVVLDNDVEIYDPTCEMAIVNPPSWEESEGVYRFAFDAEEVF